MEKIKLCRPSATKSDMQGFLRSTIQRMVLAGIAAIVILAAAPASFGLETPLWDIVPDYQPPDDWQAPSTELVFISIHFELLYSNGQIAERIAFPLFSHLVEAVQTDVEITMADPFHYVWYGRTQCETEGFVILASGATQSLRGYVFFDGRTYYIDPMRGTTIHVLYRPRRIEPEGMGSDAALPPPDMPVPTTQQIFSFDPQASPLLRSDPASSRPIGISTDPFRLRVALHLFRDLVDVYLAIYAPVFGPDAWFFIQPDNSVRPLSEGLTPWRRNHAGSPDQVVLGPYPSFSIPTGTYSFYMAVTPAGTQNAYYLWFTSITIE